MLFFLYSYAIIVSIKKETIFEINTIAGSSTQAQKIVDKWNNNAIELYPQILGLLN